MSISYEEALATLESMFGSPWTRDSLDAVLRNQKGHMENTVDLILRHGDKDPQLLVDQLQAGINPEDASRALDEQLARQLSQGPSSLQQRTSKKGKGTPTTLPNDFLRLPNAAGGSNVGASGGSTFDDDEALARMLQDELFTEELARNPDFAHLARGRPQTSVGGARRASDSRIGGHLPHPTSQTRRSVSSGAGMQIPQIPPPNLQNVVDKLGELGDNARRRLQLLAAQFNARNTSQQQQQGGGGGAAGSTSPSERRSLLDDDMDDMELAARKDL